MIGCARSSRLNRLHNEEVCPTHLLLSQRMTAFTFGPCVDDDTMSSTASGQSCLWHARMSARRRAAQAEWTLGSQSDSR